MVIMKKKSIVIVSYKIPYPAIQGGAIAQFFFLEKLVSIHDVTFCTIVNNECQRQNLIQLQKKIPKLKVVYHDQIIANRFESILLNKILIKSVSFTKKLHLYLKKRQLKIESNTPKRTTEIDSSFSFTDESFLFFFNDLLANNSFTHIQLEFYETIALLPFLPYTTKKIVIHHEIRSKKNSLVTVLNTDYQKYVTNALKIIETSFLNIADQIVVFNENDKQFLQELGDKVVVSPFGIPDSIIEKKKASSFFDKFIFLGGENHYPNKEGIEWFLDTIFIPNLKKIDWPFYIIGEWSSTTINKYKACNKIIFTGFAPTLSPYLDSSILICPIISGSGIRTKILQSFANRIPVMATPFASEGLHGNKNRIEHLIHFETANDFIMKLDQLRSDHHNIETIANKGFDYYDYFFSEKELFQKRFSIYN